MHFLLFRRSLRIHLVWAVGLVGCSLHLAIPNATCRQMPRFKISLNFAKIKQSGSRLFLIDAVNQGNYSLSINLRLECFVIVEKYKHYVKALAYLPNNSKMQDCLRCQYLRRVSHMVLGRQVLWKLPRMPSIETDTHWVQCDQMAKLF